MAKYQLEVGARTVEDALSAWRGGADRVELYVSPTEGALTPSMGLVQAAVAAKKAANSNLGLFVMLRPRSGDFLYSDADFDTLLRDTENLYAAGADGFMSGIVTADGMLDIKRMKEVMKRCPGKPFTAHTTNPVPFIVAGYDCKLREGGKLADIAPTMLKILEIEKPAEMDGESIIL